MTAVVAVKVIGLIARKSLVARPSQGRPAATVYVTPQPSPLSGCIDGRRCRPVRPAPALSPEGERGQKAGIPPRVSNRSAKMPTITEATPPAPVPADHSRAAIEAPAATACGCRRRAATPRPDGDSRRGMGCPPARRGSPSSRPTNALPVPGPPHAAVLGCRDIPPRAFPFDAETVKRNIYQIRN